MMYDEWKITAEGEQAAFARLAGIVRILRKECPWDRVQTHHTLRPCMIEEAYEACEAIDREDTENLREELGDVLLQVLFHTTLAEEERLFGLADVLNEECEKMIRRHPHVFEQNQGKNSEDSIDNLVLKWENIKRGEHQGMSCKERLSAVPSALPALLRASKVYRKATESGLSQKPETARLREAEEGLKALAGLCEGRENPVGSEEAFGDMFFRLVLLAECVGISSERALEKRTEKFIEEVSSELDH